MWLASLVATLAVGGPLFFSLTYMLTGILVLSFLWAWLNVHWVRITRQIRARHVQVGNIIEERFVVENTSWLPKLWVELADQSDLPGHRPGRVISGMGSKSQKSWHIRTPCYQRGRFTLGPVSLTSGDPFGLFQFTKSLPGFSSNVVVYPKTVDLPAFSPPVGEQTGGEAVHRRTHYVTTNVAGIRDYVFGDSFNRIHWPSSARNNRLMVKEFELDPMADVWVFLDMAQDVQAGLSYKEIPPPVLPEVHWEKLPEFTLPPSTEEYGISIAASVSKHFLNQNRAVGLITYANGQHRELAQSDRGERQLTRIYEMLAVTQAHGTIPLAEVLAAETLRFSRNITLIIVTASTTPEWVGVAHHLVSRGVRVTAVLIDSNSFDNDYDSSMAVEIELTASHIPHFVVREGNPLEQALANTRARNKFQPA